MRAVTVEAFCEMDLPDQEMVLDPVIPCQGLCMLYSFRGVGKTFLSLGIAYAVASGGSVLRWRAPKPRRVLYLDGEMPANKMQERLIRLRKGRRPLPTPDHFRIVTQDLQERGIRNLSTPEGQREAEDILHDADLLVLDNLSSLASHGEENSAESWLPLQEWALSLRSRGLSVLFVHHAGKSGQQRGTSRREDVLDTVIALRRPENYTPAEGARFEVHYEKARGFHGDDAAPFAASFRVDDDGVRWEHT